MPTVLPPSGNPLVFFDITIGGQPLTRLPIELLPTPSSPSFHAQCISAPPGYKNTRITRVIRGVGIYGGGSSSSSSFPSSSAFLSATAAGAGAGVELLPEGVVGLVDPSSSVGGGMGGVGGGGYGGGGHGGQQQQQQHAYVISLGAARGIVVGRVFGEKGEEALRMLAGVAVGRRGEGVPDLEVGVGECGEL